jgi:hypothetical protein
MYDGWVVQPIWPWISLTNCSIVAAAARAFSRWICATVERLSR